MEGNYKIVNFDEYCHSCKHKNKGEGDDPCYECLYEPVAVDSHKPIKWEEDD